MQRLQAVQNAAARLVTGTRRRDHITPVLQQLHWLPVRQRVNFKLAVLVFKALHGLAPCYLANDCQLVTGDAGRRHLRSSEAATCVLQRRLPTPASATERLELLDHLCGTASPPNSASLISLSLGQFHRTLKIFVLTGSAAPSDCLLLGAVYKFAYLLTYLLFKLAFFVLRS